MICDYGCQRDARAQLKNGKWCCQPSPNQCPARRAHVSKTARESKHKRGFYKGYQPWNAGKTADDYTPEQRASMLEGSRRGAQTTQQRGWSTETEIARRAKLRKNAKEQGYGGYKRGRGRGKKGWYRGIWCDSRWELAFVMYHLDHDQSIERNTEKFTYLFEEKQYQYLPDFLLNGALIEIKGWLTLQAKLKISQCPKPVTVIDKKEIRPYLEYAVAKYGKNFVSQYDRSEKP